MAGITPTLKYVPTSVLKQSWDLNNPQISENSNPSTSAKKSSLSPFCAEDLTVSIRPCSDLVNFPSLKCSAQLLTASDLNGISKSHSTDILCNDRSSMLEGFHFLAEAKFPMKGKILYYGKAFINKEKSQVVVSHTVNHDLHLNVQNVEDIIKSQTKDLVSCAVTFAYDVLQFVMTNNYSLFFTGHSIGGWLAQITCFTTKHMDLNSGQFVLLSCPLDSFYPYTVVFDSPNAYEFLKSITDFSKETNVEFLTNLHLPVENFLFHSHPLSSAVNKECQLSTVYFTNLTLNSKDFSSYPVALLKTIHNMDEHDAVKYIVSYNKRTVHRSFWKYLWGKPDSSQLQFVPANPKRFSMTHMLSKDEQDFVTNAHKLFAGSGKFTGTNHGDECFANWLVTRATIDWNIYVDEIMEQTFLECHVLSRQEFIPRLRQVVQSFNHRKTLWWDSNETTELPSDNIDRHFCRASEVLTERFPESFSMEEILNNETEKLFLLVDNPGAGKSCALNQIEKLIKLKNKEKTVARVNLCKLNDKFQHGLISDIETYGNILSKLAPEIPWDQLQHSCTNPTVKGLKTYLLIDDPGESLKKNEEQIVRNLRLLLEAPEGVPAYLKPMVIIASDSRSVQEMVEKEFSTIETFSLLPLSFDQQNAYLVKHVEGVLLIEDLLLKLPKFMTKELLSNPFHLKEFAKLLRARGAEKIGAGGTVEDVNVFLAYTFIIQAQHEMYLPRSVKNIPNKLWGNKELSIQDHKRHYFFFALREMLSTWSESQSVLEEQLQSLLGQEPTQTRFNLIKPFKIVTRVNSCDGENLTTQFVYRSYAEYFYAWLCEEVDKNLKQTLLNAVNDSDPLNNVETFLESSNNPKRNAFLSFISCQKILQQMTPRHEINHQLETNHSVSNKISEQVLEVEDQRKKSMAFASSSKPKTTSSKANLGSVECSKNKQELTSLLPRFSPLQIRNQAYAYDTNLNIEWSTQKSEAPRQPVTPLANYPSIEDFIKFAELAFFDHHDILETNAINKRLKDISEHFELLAIGKNTSYLNGYFGIAYVQNQKHQIILSHCGTKMTKFGSFLTDIQGIIMNQYTPQILSAMAFAHEVAKYADGNGYELFFTGHSHGAWLAQVTCFSTMYLTANEGYFVRKLPPYNNVRCRYTVVFDSPGTRPFLTKMKDDLFPSSESESLEINICTLPVEVFLFHRNFVNTTNLPVGSVYFLDHIKPGLQPSLPWGIGTHAITPAVKFISSSENWSNAVRCQVVDFRVNSRRLLIFPNTQDEIGNTIPAVANRFSINLFNKDEQKFLELAKINYPPGSSGEFEGLNKDVELHANSLIASIDSHEFKWRLFDEFGGFVVECGEWSPLEFVPLVRQTLRCLQKGYLWWNPSKPQLPQNYVDRKVYQTRSILLSTQKLKSLPFNTEDECHSDKTSDGSIPQDTNWSFPDQVLNSDHKFFFLVDLPGMGKSNVITKLEMDLRNTTNECPRIIVRLNLNQMEDNLQEQPKDEEPLDFFLRRYVPIIPLTRIVSDSSLNSPVSLYILLDGLDEVCLSNHALMKGVLRMLHNCLLRNIDSKYYSNILRLEKLVITTRPHARHVIEQEFALIPYSLFPFNTDQVITFIRNAAEGTQLHLNATKQFQLLPTNIQEIMSNPLMVSLYTKFICKRGDAPLSSLNIFDLYKYFVIEKLKLFVMEKEEADITKAKTTRRINSLLDDNLRYYYFFAVQELLNHSTGYRILECDSRELLQEPTKHKVVDLLSHGLIVKQKGSQIQFKHKSFAEFFYAFLLTNPYSCQALRDALFTGIYETSTLTNVEDFALAGLEYQKQFYNPQTNYRKPITVSKKWLRNLELEDCSTILENFYKGKLFGLLRNEIYDNETIEFNEPKYLKAHDIDSYNPIMFY